jgi:hypothetical protein
VAALYVIGAIVLIIAVRVVISLVVRGTVNAAARPIEKALQNRSIQNETERVAQRIQAQQYVDAQYGNSPYGTAQYPGSQPPYDQYGAPQPQYGVPQYGAPQPQYGSPQPQHDAPQYWNNPPGGSGGLPTGDVSARRRGTPVGRGPSGCLAASRCGSRRGEALSRLLPVPVSGV